jgi:hypothetical protein
MGLYLCLAAFVVALYFGSRSLAAGLNAVLAVGYLYGIVRANVLDGYSHLIFDAAVLGLYLTQFPRPGQSRPETRPVADWLKALIGWPVFLFLFPLQHPLIQLVGLRGNVFLLPFLLFGARLDGRSARAVGSWMAVLNLIAFGFASLEFFLGVERFYPFSPVTEIIYLSKDVANFSAHRIPACFTSAHAYAGTMVVSLPWLIGVWLQRDGGAWERRLVLLALPLTVLGVFMAAARSPIVVLIAILIVTTASGQLRRGSLIGWVVMLAGVGYLVGTQARLQRFMTLRDTEFVAKRLHGSINMNFLELLMTYPMGNGLGSGGTSIPYFLRQHAPRPIGLENEFSRILLEQGLPGLLLWVGFITWFCTRRPAVARDSWGLIRRVLWYYCVIGFLTMPTGIGTFTSIPGTSVFMVSAGWVATRAPRRPAANARTRRHGEPSSVACERPAPA